jgi:hypothetical protein
MDINCPNIILHQPIRHRPPVLSVVPVVDLELIKNKSSFPLSNQEIKTWQQ